MLDHEAVAIISRRRLPPARILGCMPLDRSVPRSTWLRLRRAWPFAAIAILAMCLALKLLAGLAWFFALGITLIGVVGIPRVVRQILEERRSPVGRSPTAMDQPVPGLDR